MLPLRHFHLLISDGVTGSHGARSGVCQEGMVCNPNALVRVKGLSIQMELLGRSNDANTWQHVSKAPCGLYVLPRSQASQELSARSRKDRGNTALASLGILGKPAVSTRCCTTSLSLLLPTKLPLQPVRTAFKGRRAEIDKP